MSKAEISESVPQAEFIKDVGEYLKDKENADVALKDLRELYQRYKYVEQQVVQRKQRLTYKEPEIKKCLDAVCLLIERKEAGEDETAIDFSLADQIFAKAKVSGVESVNLWLGAGVMLEYTLEDARQLLETQLAGCKKQLIEAQNDYDYIKDQITTVEVSIARVYNYDISKRRAEGKST